ncbi:MAG: translation initiation factor IF-6 [Candidatus Micrarchaeales archaeon]|jgi:translation initiation factor 6
MGGIEKLRILGNDYVGAWVTATDKFFLCGSEATNGEERIIKETIGIDGIRLSIGGSGLVGIYVVANSNCILLPNVTQEYELKEIKQTLPQVNVEIFPSDYNALRNNILTNDKIAIINPGYSREEERRIGELLHVETVRLAIANFGTVGANNIMTNKGFVINNRATEAECEKVEKLLGLKVEQSTANLGSVSIGMCTIANSNGLVVGEATTGFELARIAESLNIE